MGRKSENQIKRLESLHFKVLKSGYTNAQLQKMDKKTFNKTFGFKIKSKSSLEGRKRLLNQIARKQSAVVKYSIKKHGITSKKYIKFIEDETKRQFKPVTGGGKQKKPKKPVYTWTVYERIQGRKELKHSGYTTDKGLLKFFGQRDDKTSKGHKWRSERIKDTKGRIIPQGYLEAVYYLDEFGANMGVFFK